MSAAEPLPRDAHDEAIDLDMARYAAARGGERVSHAEVRAWLLSDGSDRPPFLRTADVEPR